MQHIHWKITQPCHESLENMDITPRGHFCHSCQKEVINLDGFTPQDIGYKTGDMICGRMAVYTPVVSDVTMGKWSALMLKWMGISALFFIPLKKGKSQEVKHHHHRPDSLPQKRSLSTKKIIGTLRGDNNKPVRATVTLTDSTGKKIAETQSITNGKYLLEVDTAAIEGDSVTLTQADTNRYIWTLDTSQITAYPKDSIYIITTEVLITLGWTVPTPGFVSGDVVVLDETGMVTGMPQQSNETEMAELKKKLEWGETPFVTHVNSPTPKKQPLEEKPEKPLAVMPPAATMSRSHKTGNKK